MYRACIVTADTHHCQIYLLDRTIGEDKLDERFVELEELSSTHADGHGHHEAKRVAELAHHVMARVRELADEHGVSNLFVVSGPRMLGFLRDARPGILPLRMTVTEVPHELTNLSPHELRAHLASQHLLPPVPEHVPVRHAAHRP